MSHEDRERWNRKYSGALPVTEPSGLVTVLADLLPGKGRALDLAGGAGRHAIWLAQRGLEVTLADISPVALALAEERARVSGVLLKTVEVDLELAPLPAGPWQLILSFHFLYRPLLPLLVSALAPGGVLVVVQPTIRNLERHTRPPAAYLLKENELRQLAGTLEIVSYREGWLEEGRCEAVLVGRKAGRASVLMADEVEL